MINYEDKPYVWTLNLCASVLVLCFAVIEHEHEPNTTHNMETQTPKSSRCNIQ